MADKTWWGETSGDVGNYNNNANWVEGTKPAAADDVRIPVDSANITGGLAQSAVQLSSFTVEPGYTGEIGIEPSAGSTAQYLAIDSNEFSFAGEGKAFIDFQNSVGGNVDLIILKTAVADVGEYGLYIKGADIDDISILSGSVGLATYLGDSLTASTLNVMTSEASAKLGAGTPNVNVFGGECEISSNAGSTITTVTHFNGELTTSGDIIITTLRMTGGRVFPNSTGTITTLTQDGGELDVTQQGVARTITTWNFKGGSFVGDETLLSVTTRGFPDRPYRSTIVYV